MKQSKLGKAEIVEKNDMGCLPIQRIPKEDAIKDVRTMKQLEIKGVDAN